MNRNNSRTHWQSKKLGEIIVLEYGKPLPESRRKFDGKFPVYGASGIIGFYGEKNVN